MPSGGSDEADFTHMGAALRLARRALGTTAPNPAVGAVVVDERRGIVLARGWTQPGGRPHAEPQALARAGDSALGATLYVTLEPCSHFGQTAPCADTIISAGVGRVVCGIEDPDPRVSSRGLRRIEEAGIAVRRFVRADEAHWLTRGHILRVTERRPFVQLKMALSAAGEAPIGRGGRPVWVTGPDARRHGHLLRAETDAILVGSGTVTADDPELTCRLPGARWRSPVRVVLASDLAIDPQSRLARTAREIPVWIFCADGAEARRQRALSEAGCEVIPVRSVAGCLWLPAVMEALVARGTTRLLVEGGPSTWAAFARAALVDEVVLFRARPATGGEVLTHEAVLTRLTAGFSGRLVAHRRLGPDDMFVVRRLPPSRTRPPVTGSGP